MKKESLKIKQNLIYKIKDYNDKEQKNNLSNNKSIKKNDSYSFITNEIYDNINNFNINSYKLRIFKKFIY